MQKAVAAIKKSFIYMSALVLVAGYPTIAMATSQEPVTDPAPAVTETPEVAGSEKKELNYTYDPETKKWNSEKWQWNPESGKYEKPPEPIIIEPKTPAPASAEGADESGPASTEEESSSSQNTTEKNVDTEVNVNNTVTSDATSGDSLISGNTSAGSALTGDAETVANIVNAVNSSVGAEGNKKIATFTKDIVGDVKGDIVLYPLLLKAMLENEAQKQGSTTINSTTDMNLHNDINLNAKSGDATVEGNTRAGDATTGNATAMANVVNILNSLIATQDSFIGTVNIYGSLEGDILIAPDFIPQMIANNGGGGSGTKLSTQDTTTIVNNISAVAESGAASVFGNTSGGNATTGDADSNVVIFNVTGHDIVAENSMLVFVNVLGRWVGMIVDAPEGATAAMIGNGVTKNDKYAPDLTVESRSQHGITNTIAVNAETGDAVVANNTTAGNATSGNAKAIANVANISGSQVSLTGWFGLLFINVMGDWFGSFQVDTPYGNLPKETESTPAPAGPVQFIPETERPRHQPARVVPTVIDSRQYQAPLLAVATTASDSEEAEVKSVASTPEVKGATNLADTEIYRPKEFQLWMALGSLLVMGISAIGLRRLL